MSVYKALFFILLTVNTSAHSLVENNEISPLEQQFSAFLSVQSNERDNETLIQIQQFYQRNQYQPVWTNGSELLPRAYTLFNALMFAEKKGLDPLDYKLEKIRSAWQKPLENDFTLEFLLTHAFIRYSRDLYQGRFNPGEVDPDWHIAPANLVVADLLEQLRQQTLESILTALEPRHPAYRQLRSILHRYQKIAEQGGWLKIPEGPVLKTGMQHAQVAMIRNRLGITHDLVSGSQSDSDHYDEVLAEAVMRFQARHALVIDGHVGGQTRAAMNVSVQQRLQQILVNMERWRWLPRDFESRYLIVNMTGFELYALEDDKVVLAMPIIIGKTYRATPAFSSKLAYLEINPYWTIPKKIVLEDLIPAEKRNPGYLARKKIRVFDGWGQDAQELEVEEIPLHKLNRNYFPYMFRQDPGPGNSLGRIKFMFPNPYDIYLHDTPARYLFERQTRMFSSGCIRVSDPIRLTAYLLNNPSQQKEEKVLSMIYRGVNRSLSLLKPVPIYLIYMTAWADQAENIIFREDIYQRDAIMLEMLNLSRNYSNSVN